jgi:hypothetical protein
MRHGARPEGRKGGPPVGACLRNHRYLRLILRPPTEECVLRFLKKLKINGGCASFKRYDWGWALTIGDYQLIWSDYQNRWYWVKIG